ncbi:unnamed protein product [Ectocarpus sp. 6 AP-2014]
MSDLSGGDLHSASEYGDVGKVRTLVKSADGRLALNSVQDAGRTPLQLASREGHVLVVEELVAAGANVNFRSPDDGRHAIHLAAGKGHNTVVNILLEAGAEEDAGRGLSSTWTVGANLKTPLVEAIENGHFPVVQTLLSKGADATLDVGCSTRDLGDMSLRPIDFAALRGDNDIMTALLSDIDEDCFLEFTIILACRRGHFAVVKTLLDNGCDVKTSQFDFDQPLICAAGGGHDAIVTLLLENEADPNEVRMDGETPLSSAVRFGHVRIIKALLNAGAEREYDYSATKTKAVVEAILDSGAEPDEEELGYLLSIGVRETSTLENMYDARLMLLQRGAPVNFCSYGGQTPLHHIMNRRSCVASVVDLLLRWGADETMKDERGKTPADYLGRIPNLDPAVAERVRHLLVNAPRDRAWRRRGWLVMLRAHTLAAGEPVDIPEPKKRGGGGGVCPLKFVLSLNEDAVFREVVAFL